MSSKQYSAATTLTQILMSNDVIIYDEHHSGKVRSSGVGKLLKRDAVQQLSESRKIPLDEAEATVERRLFTLMRLGKIMHR